VERASVRSETDGPDPAGAGVGSLDLGSTRATGGGAGVETGTATAAPPAGGGGGPPVLDETGTQRGPLPLPSSSPLPLSKPVASVSSPSSASSGRGGKAGMNPGGIGTTDGTAGGDGDLLLPSLSRWRRPLGDSCAESELPPGRAAPLVEDPAAAEEDEAGYPP
jgi:hypothetical protein